MQPFISHLQSPRVLFGDGSFDRLESEVRGLGVTRALVLSTPGQRPLAERALGHLGGAGAMVFAGAVMHVPREVVDQAIAACRVHAVDGFVAVGGGSTVGLAKALALLTSLPIVAVPTTYAGSEMTSMHGITEGGAKRTGRDTRVVPRVVLYDPQLTLGLPLRTSVTSAFNAIAHAAEGLYAPDGNPVVSLLAEEGVRAFAGAVPRLHADLRDADARAQALYGAWLCGMVMGATTVGLHHKLCHTLGGLFDLPHAELHAVLLPYTLAYNAPHAPEAMKRLARSLDAPAEGAPSALYRLGRDNGVPASLAAIGMPQDGIDAAAAEAVRSPYPNPRPLERDAIRDLLARAFDGAGP